MNKIYLGDSVYVAIDGVGSVVLTTENGYPDDPRNRIVLEPEVIENLLLYLVSLPFDRRTMPVKP